MALQKVQKVQKIQIMQTDEESPDKLGDEITYGLTVRVTRDQEKELLRALHYPSKVYGHLHKKQLKKIKHRKSKHHKFVYNVTPNRSSLTLKEYINYLSTPRLIPKPDAYKRKQLSPQPYSPRFAHLAVPVRRNVFNTWTNFYDVLPIEHIYMLRNLIEKSEGLIPEVTRKYFKRLDVRRRLIKRIKAKKHKKEKKKPEDNTILIEIEILVDCITKFFTDDMYMSVKYVHMLITELMKERLEFDNLIPICKRCCDEEDIYGQTLHAVFDQIAIWMETVMSQLDEEPADIEVEKPASIISFSDMLLSITESIEAVGIIAISSSLEAVYEAEMILEEIQKLSEPKIASKLLMLEGAVKEELLEYEEAKISEEAEEIKKIEMELEAEMKVEAELKVEAEIKVEAEMAAQAEAMEEGETEADIAAEEAEAEMETTEELMAKIEAEMEAELLEASQAEEGGQFSEVVSPEEGSEVEEITSDLGAIYEGEFSDEEMEKYLELQHDEEEEELFGEEQMEKEDIYAMQREILNGILDAFLLLHEEELEGMAEMEGEEEEMEVEEFKEEEGEEEGEEEREEEGLIMKKELVIEEHSPDAVCCVTLKTWTTWLVEVAHNTHSWCQWIQSVIAKIRYYAAVLKGEIKTEEGKKRILYKDEWLQFVETLNNDIAAWLQYNDHVRQISEEIISNFANKRIICCKACLKSQLIISEETAHQVARQLVEAIKATTYWRSWLDVIVMEADKLLILPIELPTSSKAEAPKTQKMVSIETVDSYNVFNIIEIKKTASDDSTETSVYIIEEI